MLTKRKLFYIYIYLYIIYKIIYLIKSENFPKKFDLKLYTNMTQLFSKMTQYIFFKDLFKSQNAFFNCKNN